MCFKLAVACPSILPEANHRREKIGVSSSGVHVYLYGMQNPVISVEHLFKSYRKVRAVLDLNFEVFPRTCVAFLGPNGAGKTTTMKMLYGKAAPDGNPKTKITVFGTDPRRDELSIKAIAGVAPQEENLDLELNVVQNLRIFANFYRMRGRAATARIEELLRFMELSEKRTARVRELSGGMKRRLIIARALLNRPRLLILDEPTTGLDPQVRRLIWEKLHNLMKTEGVTILLTTHYMEEAYQLADNIVIMDKGRKVIEGEPRRLLSDNIEKYVLELLDPSLQARVEHNGNLNGCRKDGDAQRVLYYSEDLQSLERLSAEIKQRDYIIRESNLEDLFLQTTGRRLNELQ